ncbi:MAG: SPOR domain-containing protein [Flavobacteriales bacterium]|nr:SPOR domain-containing protein [Flavobacteriales bacterium]
MVKRVVFTILTCVLWGGVTFAQDSNSVKTPTPPVGVVFKPTIGVGTGMFTFYGDITLGQKTNLPIISRIGYDLRVTQPLTEYLDMNFYVLFGQLGANERSLTRNLNFESTIRMGGIALSYNFNHALPKDRLIDPYIMVGIESFEFLSKTDLYDEHGNMYYYWSDGSIRNIDEADPNADDAIRLTRDYTYESDVRELDIDGFGKYPERSWAVPIGVGANLHVSERVKFRIGAAMHFTFTDYVDGITDQSIGDRIGDAANDKFLFTSFNLNYQIGVEPTSVLEEGFDDYDFRDIDTDDEDLDLVRDFEDDCPGTPADAIVDDKGCPLDGDKDGVPDYLDDELDTPDSSYVDLHGVAITDEMMQAWNDKYTDSTGAHLDINVVERPISSSDKIERKIKKKYQLIVKSEGIQAELTEKEAQHLLSMPGITMDTDKDGNMVIVAASSNDLNEITRRKLELDKQNISSEIVENKPDRSKEAVPDDQLPDVKEETPTPDDETPGSTTASIPSDGLIYRVQLGAFSRKLSDDIFKDLPNSFSYTSSEDGLTRYFTGSFGNYKETANHKINMIEEGFEDAFIVSFKDGKKVPLSSTGSATPINKQVDIDDQISTSASDVKFRVQVAAYDDEIPADVLSKLLQLDAVEQRKSDDGQTKFIAGIFDTYEEAQQYATELVGEGNDGAFVVGELNGKLISSDEALELQK